LQPGDTWSTIGIGKFSLPLAATAIALGGHCRVGLEDNNRLPDGSLATNAKLTQYIVDLAALMGRQLATPAEARQILGLPVAWKDRILPQLGLAPKEPEEEKDR
jgi:3-keto-5-aminohexanoate cleavage enzyme